LLQAGPSLLLDLLSKTTGYNEDDVGVNLATKTMKSIWLKVSKTLRLSRSAIGYHFFVFNNVRDTSSGGPYYVVHFLPWKVPSRLRWSMASASKTEAR
jgi:hypothetical protein